MLRLLQLLFYGHSHYWETKEEINIKNLNGKYIGLIYVCRCTKCGEIKETRIET